VPEDGHVQGDSITMRAALRTSSNRAAVRMLEDVGISTAVRYAERMGVGSVPSVPSLALGSGEVTLVSMTAAFGVFANHGMLAQPVLITRVETQEGEVLFRASSTQQRALSEATSFLMTTMLADVVNAGTAWQARRVGFTLPAAGKTGTTNDYHDAWFVGYTPSLVTGVWVGYDQPRTIISNGYAADLAVPLWGRFMKIATDGDEPRWFKAPATVSSANICRLSGKLATDACRHERVVAEDGTVSSRPMVYTEFFVRGTEPIDYCPYHGFSVGLPGTVATSGADGPGPTPPPAGAPSPAAPPVVTVAGEPPSPPPAEAAQPEQKRRGFWGRLFGRGRDRDDDRREQQEPRERRGAQGEDRRQQ
jgi:penicillin-binding protein 1A